MDDINKIIADLEAVVRILRRHNNNGGEWPSVGFISSIESAIMRMRSGQVDIEWAKKYLLFIYTEISNFFKLKE